MGSEFRPGANLACHPRLGKYGNYMLVRRVRRKAGVALLLSRGALQLRYATATARLTNEKQQVLAELEEYRAQVAQEKQQALAQIT